MKAVSCNNFIKKLYDFIEKYYYAFFIIIILIAGMNVFNNISLHPFADWDEARHGVNAYEMIRNNNYIVNTYNGVNDYWNLKPPLSYWVIIAGYKIFGYNALGLRFFSGIFAVLTIILIGLFTKHKHGKLASLIASSVLTTSTQFIIFHSARTGDADALFVLLFTIAMLSMLLIRENIKWMYIAGLAFSLAFLTKSWHALTIVAIGGLYLLITGKLFKIKLKEFIIFILSSTILILIWVVVRYTQDGMLFIKEMIRYDLLKRSANPIEGHVGDIYFYFDVLKVYYFYWIVLFFGVFIGYLAINETKEYKNKSSYTLGIILWIMLPFLLFTKAKTKLPWYIIPIFPPLAICLGSFANKLMKEKYRNVPLQLVIIFSLVLCLFVNEQMIYKYTRNYQTDDVQNILSEFKNRKDYNGEKIYIVNDTVLSNNHEWSQKHFLAAQLYGDFYPTKGGLEGFLNDTNPKSLIIITKDDNSKNIKDKYNLKILYENNSNYVFIK